MIIEKGSYAFLCVTEKEGKRANYRRGRASERREVASVQRSTY